MKARFRCKGIGKKQNSMSWNRYSDALKGHVDKGQNTGFRVNNKQMLIKVKIPVSELTTTKF